MKPKQKAVFLDIDGTLLSGDSGPFDCDIEAINAAQQAGHYVFINTGRSYANLPPVIKNAKYFDGFVCGAGTHIILHDRTIYHRWVDPVILAKISEYYFDTKKWFVFEGEENIYSINQIEFSFSLSECIPLEDKDAFLKKYKKERITKLTFGDIVTQENKHIFKNHFTIIPFPDYTEAILRGHTKASGMKTILKEIGVHKKDSFALGDSLNDAEMIKFAGYGIAMGNACDEIKQMAKAVTLDCDKGGVAKAIEQYVLA